jgi:hypothetical protein
MKSLTYIAIALLLLVTGSLVSFWPLYVLALVLLAASGQVIAALLAGFVLDALFGKSAGTLLLLYVPFTLLALVLSLIRLYLSTYLLERDPLYL